MSDNLVLLSEIIIRNPDLYTFKDLLVLDKFEAPFNKHRDIHEVIMQNGVRLLRLRIREGSRFTIMDLDPVTAERWGTGMTDWARRQHTT